MSINFKINVKRKVIINGVEYGSPEELPPELRAAYEKALAAKNRVDFSASLATVLKTNHTAKITVNGRAYDNLEAMPEDDRKLYTQAMGAVRAESAPDTETGALPVTPRSIFIFLIHRFHHCRGLTAWIRTFSSLPQARRCFCP